jgi:hypothetical protein
MKQQVLLSVPEGREAAPKPTYIASTPKTFCSCSVQEALVVYLETKFSISFVFGYRGSKRGHHNNMTRAL